MSERSTLKNLLIHLVIIFCISVGLVLSFFFLYLPSTTNHGESITVPDLKGMYVSQLDEFLLSRSLRFEVQDSSYSEKYDPLTILKQYPRAGSRVKENRKIFISVNAVNPPTVPMPDLIDGPLKNAQVVLKSNELRIGNITSKPDLAFNAVLEMIYKGKIIEAGSKIPKGSVIDLVVGNGYGKQTFPTPNIISYQLDDAKYYLKGIGLTIGRIFNAGDSTNATGYIYQQDPSPDSTIRIGQSVDLWVIPEYDSSQFEYYDQLFTTQEDSLISFE